MSYEIVKNISRKKDNRIFITSACNNLCPHTFEKWEYLPNEKCNEEELKNKMLYLFHGIIGNSYQLQGSVNDKWKYAENKFLEYCQNNNINTYDLWDLPYKNGDYNIELLKPYYDIFESFLNEKEKKGKYYLKSDLGYITKVNKKSFEYNAYWLDAKKCKNYKKIYNDYCKLSTNVRQKYNIKIEEYVIDKKRDDEKSDSMELIL